MARRRPPAIAQVAAFLESVGELAAALPSKEQKAELERDLDALIAFLTTMREYVTAAPAGDDETMVALARAVESLGHHMQSAEGNPILAAVLKPKRGAPRRTGQGKSPKQVREVVRRLGTMTPDEIQRDLDGGNFTVAELKEIAGAFGIRVPSKARRASVLGQIARHAENEAGYKLLRHMGTGWEDTLATAREWLERRGDPVSVVLDGPPDLVLNGNVAIEVCSLEAPAVGDRPAATGGDPEGVRWSAHVQRRIDGVTARIGLRRADRYDEWRLILVLDTPQPPDAAALAVSVPAPWVQVTLLGALDGTWWHELVAQHHGRQAELRKDGR